jgi:hypothetical protein
MRKYENKQYIQGDHKCSIKYGFTARWRAVLFYEELKDKLCYVARCVSVPDVIIEGSPDIHAQSGSSVTLTCLVKNAIQEPTSVSW